ncbi:MAG: L-aspartate oxidase [Bacteroidetes bacterium]|nr:MAG: L-aspartate oxidase [Bacteroidota bacterium]
METDVLVIGAGIGGLTAAIELAEARPDLDIVVLTKTHTGESNTRYAQGGVATVWDASDTFESHVADTLDAGDGLCDEAVVRMVVEGGPERIRKLIAWGARFDRNEAEGDYDLGREGGHSAHRILHYKDLTGWEIQRTLVARAAALPNIRVLEHYFAIDLITQHHLGHVVTRVTPDIECYGAYALNKETGQIERLLSRLTILATGGAGQVYKNTTNPVIATGDGIAMVYRAKGRIENMEFVQFHPTALYNPAGENPAFLISEAVRGFGAVLKTPAGEPFMERYDPRGSLAPRDIVARAIDREMKIGGYDYMCLDCRHLDREAFKAHFPTIYDKCMHIGIDPMRDLIPVTPACHYMCGGVRTDTEGRTSIHRLYACGECACTGLHGANRLASNSLLEALVFAKRIADHALGQVDRYDLRTDIPEWDARGVTQPEEQVLITQELKELKEVMSYYVGIVRNNLRLKRAMDRLYLLYRETEELYHRSTLSPQLCELRNLITIGYLITRSATMRRESRGLHYNTDYPDKLPFADSTIL